MNFLEERIAKDGIVKPGNVLKVDSFLNHQMDIQLFERIGQEFRRRFADTAVDKILTIEASGIGVACITAHYFQVPVVFAKKAKTVNLGDHLYTSKIYSFTHQQENVVIVSKEFLHAGERILVLDDFLASGSAIHGLIDIIAQAGASLAGIGIVVEKGFQDGGRLLREEGHRVESIAIVESMDSESRSIRFREQK